MFPWVLTPFFLCHEEVEMTETKIHGGSFSFRHCTSGIPCWQWMVRLPRRLSKLKG